MKDDIDSVRERLEGSWRDSYAHFPGVIRRFDLRIGVEVGVAFGGHAEAILANTSVRRLHGVDSYVHRADYVDPMNLDQVAFDQLYEDTKKRLVGFGDRFILVRAESREASRQVPDELDFVYLDADHSYPGVWDELLTWFPKVRIGGIVGGHDYGHAQFPGVQEAVDRFFGRLESHVHLEGNGVWWVEKPTVHVSFVVPAFNCESTIEGAVRSILDGNFHEGDEIIVVDDGSTDGTAKILETLPSRGVPLRVLKHGRNKGGGAARNTAVENARSALLFCLDADNLLSPGSVASLKEFLLESGADAAAFGQLRYFSGSPTNVTHVWEMGPETTLADCLSGWRVPPSSGNYLFTRESWVRAGGYPEFAGALDAWGFGVRQLASGAKMKALSGTYYYHRYGHESYWVRFSRAETPSLVAMQILVPYFHLIEEKDLDYMLGSKGRLKWFSTLDRRPIRLKRVKDSGRPGVSLSTRLRRLVRKTLLARK